MLLNYNNQNHFINHYPTQNDLIRNQPVNYNYVIQHETPNPSINNIKKLENQIEQDKNSSINEDDQNEDTQIDDLGTNENDEDHLYLTFELPAHAANKLKNLNPEQMNQIKQLGILGIQFENETSNIRIDNLNLNGSIQNDECQSKKRPRKTVLELTCVSSSQEQEPKAKKSKVKDESDENMSDDMKNIYQIRQMLSQQAQKEDEVEKIDQGEKPKKPRQRAPPDPNKPKVKRNTKTKNENSIESQQPVQQVHSQPPVRINQLIQQNAYINQNVYQQQQQFNNQHHFQNNQEQMKIRNILFYNSNSNVQDGSSASQTNGFMEQQQKLQNSNYLILNSTSDCNSNSNMTSNSDLSMTNNSYPMSTNQINFLNI